MNVLSKKTAIAATAFLAVWGTVGHGTVLAPGKSAKAVADHYDTVPPAAVSDDPLVMLVLSNDNQLFVKAYTDYTDLDNDGALDTTYNNSFEYYGYFNSDKCYDYDSAQNRFIPNGDVDGAGAPPHDHKCTGSGGAWSGNFLNWVSMTRMDVVRKVLYGGKRSTDTAAATVLERALIPSDIHAFVKVVDSTKIDGTVADYTPYSDSTVSFCNVTLYAASGDDQTRKMDTVSHPPLIRVAAGAYPQWATTEREQCLYKTEGNSSGDTARPPISASLNSGSVGGGTVSRGSLVARVEVCVNGQDQGAAYCREYTDSAGIASYKPSGALQKYGEKGSALRFGLITGSYRENIQGGVLRRNVSQFAGGNSVDDEVNLDDGTFLYPANSIVKTLDSMRIAGWDYSSTTYDDCSTYGIPISTFKTSANNNRQCRDWGNPLAEMYLEALRYFAGASAATAGFASTDNTWVTGMETAPWKAAGVLTPDNQCANCSILVLSTGLNSFDADNLGSAADLPSLSGASDVKAWTGDVGDEQGITGNDFIVGNADGTTNSGLCDSKTIGAANGLGAVLGLCPEIPQLEGSYNIAGLAYYARKTDLRPYLSGDQVTTTYTVALAESLPSFEIPTSNGNTVTFVPSCRANVSGSATLADTGWTDCSMANVEVASQTANYGQFNIAWEDSYWGNDYDMDAIAVIEYCTATGTAAQVQAACPKYSTNGTAPDWGGATTGEIQLRVSVAGAAAGNALAFGFVMNGSTADGTYINLLRPGGVTINRLNGQTTGTIGWDSVRTFMAAPSRGKLLENPLWYAAKFGGFEDYDGDGTPANASGDSREWDSKDLDGNTGADGIPDNFFPVRNPAQLNTRIEELFRRIADNIAASSSTAVVANAVGGAGALYQGIYQVFKEDNDGRRVDWSGSVITFFIDNDSYYREDRNGDARLDSSDPIVNFYENNQERVVFDRTTVGGSLIEAGVPIEELESTWDASDQLGFMTDAEVLTQRKFTGNPSTDAKASAGRYIFTWIDQPDGNLSDKQGNGLVEDSEIRGFTVTDLGVSAALTPAASTDIEPARFLGFDSTNQFDSSGNNLAEALVNYIRGQDQPALGWRSRQIDMNDDGVPETQRLGDIINSSPAVVGAPNERYATLYRDKGYATYQQAYKDRRQMVYVGANDGMLHAFNGGFFNQTKTYVEFLTNNPNGPNYVQHPLGSEVWAYVPGNLLPHLQWLKDPAYPHVSYVDGDVQAFDVNIFSDNDDRTGASAGSCVSDARQCKHPFGWGTILVVTMRLGGGDITIDPDSDLDVNPADDRTLRSAVMVFDVTDPESPPTLLAEVTHPELGYTTSQPTLVKKRVQDNSSSGYDEGKERWLLVFGSGPAGTDAASKQSAQDEAVSNQAARVFALDITDANAIEGMVLGNGTPAANKLDPLVLASEANSFVGNPTPMDWDYDYTDDVVYFGTAGTASGIDTGHLFRLVPTDDTLTKFNDVQLLDGSVSDANMPFTAAPLAVKDEADRAWIFVGAGRFLAPRDMLTTQQLSFYGLIEPRKADGSIDFSSTISKDKLVDTTDILVFESGDVTTPTKTQPVSVESPSGTSYGSANTYSQLRSLIPNNAPGWFFDLGFPLKPPERPTSTRSRSLRQPVMFGHVVLFDEYTPHTNTCQIGTARVMTPSMYTGTPSPEIIFATDSSNVFNNADQVLGGMELGSGQVIGLSKHNDHLIWVKGGKNLNPGGGKPKYGKPNVDGRRSWREIPLNREF